MQSCCHGWAEITCHGLGEPLLSCSGGGAGLPVKAFPALVTSLPGKTGPSQGPEDDALLETGLGPSGASVPQSVKWGDQSGLIPEGAGALKPPDHKTIFWSACPWQSLRIVRRRACWGGRKAESRGAALPWWPEAGQWPRGGPPAALGTVRASFRFSASLLCTPLPAPRPLCAQGSAGFLPGAPAAGPSPAPPSLCRPAENQHRALRHVESSESSQRAARGRCEPTRVFKSWIRCAFRH